MATSFAASHGHTFAKGEGSERVQRRTRGRVTEFCVDLINDIRHELLGAKDVEEVDLFRKHMNAMAITYFAIIVVCMLAALPVLAYWVNYNWQ